MKISIAFLAFLLIGANDGAFGVLLPPLAVHYQVTNATLSLLFLANAAGYLVAAMNTGFLMPKLGRRVFLLIGFASLGCGMGALLLMPPFIVMLALFLPIGFGIALLDAGLNAYVAGFPNNTALLNYLHACYGTGALLGPLLASTILALGFTWSKVYLILTRRDAQVDRWPAPARSEDARRLPYARSGAADEARLYRSLPQPLRPLPPP